MSMTCPVCRVLSQDETLTKTITTFIADRLPDLEREDIAREVGDVLNTHMRENANRQSMDIDAEHRELETRDVLTHMQHMGDDRVVMGLLLNDTISLAHQIRCRCVFECPDSGNQLIDSKAVAVYLRTVDTVAAMLRGRKQKQLQRAETQQ